MKTNSILTRRRAVLLCGAPMAVLAQPAERGTTVTLFLRPEGFIPRELKLLSSVVTFHIVSKTGQASIDFQITRDTGGPGVGALRADLAGKGSNIAQDTVRLTPGKYVLRAVGNPKAVCNIEVAPR